MPVQTRRGKAVQDSAGEKDSKAASQPLTESGAGAKLVRAREDEPETPAKGALTVFGDDDEGELKASVESSSNNAVAVAASKEIGDSQEEEEEDSDDEAPEAVSTAKAAEDIKKSTQAAQKVAQEQAATQKRKRQQRDELLKKQAEERKKAEEQAAALRKPEDEEEDAVRQPEPSSGRKRLEKPNIPAVLPVEFLTDSSSEDEAGDSTSAASRPKRRKVSGIEKRLTRLDVGPKDEVVGSTVYRVGKKTDERLAPKLKKYSKSSKEGLLKRHRSAVKPKSGFLTRK